ncbi:hypothetical protein [Methanosarcina acetivorans]|nr:hypothetical protein [Methanosarcina acetivorans]
MEITREITYGIRSESRKIQALSSLVPYLEGPEKEESHGENPELRACSKITVSILASRIENNR